MLTREPTTIPFSAEALKVALAASGKRMGAVSQPYLGAIYGYLTAVSNWSVVGHEGKAVKRHIGH